MKKQVRQINWGQDSDPRGNPLALVIYTDRTCEYVPHTEFGGPKR